MDNVASRDTNRSNLPKIGTHKALTVADLPQVYKKAIAKQPKAEKATYEEVSLILEGIVRKITGEDDGEVSEATSEQKRMSVPGSHKNLVKLLPPLEGGKKHKYED